MLLLLRSRDGARDRVLIGRALEHGLNVLLKRLWVSLLQEAVLKKLSSSWSLVRIHGDTLVVKVLEGLGGSRWKWCRTKGSDLHVHLEHAKLRMGRLSIGHFKGRDPKRPNVTLVVIRLLQHFWGHPMRCAHD